MYRQNQNTQNISDTKTWTYDVISQQYPDKYAKVVDDYLDGSPIKVVNKLPIKVYAVVQRGLNFVMQFDLEPRGSTFLKWNEIQDADLVSFYYNPSGKNNESVIEKDGLRHVCPTHSITKRHGTILVANVSSYVQTYKRDVSPSSDLSSINVHNMLPWDLTITKSGSNRVAMYVQANRSLDSFTYNGNIAMSPSVYYDNFNQGVDVGTKFSVYANTTFSEPTNDINKLTYLYSFTINDIDEDRIIIGVISSVIDKSNMTGLDSKNSGRAIYRLGKNEPAYNDTPTFIPGRQTYYAFDQKYGKGSDKHRNTFGSDKRSTVETARYKQLSGANVLYGDQIGRPFLK
jgi:hypothetical protein